MKIYENGKNWIIEDYLELNFIKEISEILENNKHNLISDKKGYSTEGKNSNQYWLINLYKKFFISDKNYYEFEKKYRNEILSRLKKSGLLDKDFEKSISLNLRNSWIVSSEENSYHSIHNHCGKNLGISTVVYIKVPRTNVESEISNDIYFVMDSNSNQMFYYNLPPSIHINPEVGKLLIFPDWILHGTYPQTKGIRQTFNVDYQLLSNYERSNKKFIGYF
jgi:hypothetical protein